MLIDQIFDIETRSLDRAVLESFYTPGKTPDLTAPPATARKSMAALEKWQGERMSAYQVKEAARRAKALGKGALAAHTGSVVCIGIADKISECCPYVGQQWHDENLGSFVLTERDVIGIWIFRASKTIRIGGRVIGHNNFKFDFPFLFQRCAILGIPCADLFRQLRRGRYWRDDRAGDTQEEWLIGNSTAKGIKLNKLGAILGCGSKTSSGDHVEHMSNAETAEYCMGDIRLTRAIAGRLGMLTLDDNEQGAISMDDAGDESE
jgi:hypothetical protein